MSRPNTCPNSWMPYVAALTAVALYSVMDALMKGASLAVGAYSALLWRSLMGVVLMVPLWRLRGGRWPAGSALRLHLLRGLVAAGVALAFFWGLERLPLAEAIAISFLAPLIALFLAAVTLGERVRRSAIVASLIGLAGVVLIAGTRIQASSHGEGAAWGVAAVLASAVLYAWNLVLQRRQAQVAGPLEVTAFMNVTMAMVFLPAAPFLAHWPAAPLHQAEIIGSAVLAVTALSLFSWAYARAEAQALVPLEYSAFVWAALMGWAMFGEGLTIPTLLGTTLVVAACLIAAPRADTEQTSI